jgi:hypothetical protein
MHAFFRFQTRHLFTFDYDQEMIMDKVISIHQGKFTLIGTRIGEYPFYLGPAYIYFTALTSLPWHGSPFFMFYYAYFWSLLALLSLVYWTKRLFSTKAALFLGTVYALTPYTVYVDRISWNPNPVPFIAIMVVGYVFDWIINKHIPTIIEQIIIGLLLGFGINCHFSVLLLWIWLFIVVLGKKQFKMGMVIFSIALVFVLPLVLFDVRHQFLNFHGLLSLASSSHGKQFSLKLSYPSVVKLRMVGEMVIRIFGIYFSKFTFVHMKIGWLIMLVGLLVAGWPLELYASLLVGLGLVFFGYYSGAVPEYYYLYLTPLLFWIPGKVMFSLPKWVSYVLSLVLLVNLLRLSMPVLIQPASQSLECKYKTLEYIAAQVGSQPVDISYEMKPGWNFGYRYIAAYLGLTVDNEANHVFNLTYPVSQLLPSDNRAFEKRYCDIGINQHWK